MSGAAFSYNGFTFDSAGNANYSCKSWQYSVDSRFTPVMPPRADTGKLYQAGRGAIQHQLHIDVMGTSTTDYRTRMDALAASFTGVIAGLYPIAGKYWLCGCSKLATQEDSSMILSRAIVTATFDGADSFLLYDAAPTGMPTFGPYANPSTPNQTQNYTVACTAYVQPIFTLVGPLQGPITVTVGTQNWSWSGNLASTDTLVVDCSAGTVTLNGTRNFADFSGDSTTAGIAMVLVPGVNAIQFQAANGNNGGNMTFTFTQRDQGLA